MKVKLWLLKHTALFVEICSSATTFHISVSKFDKPVVTTLFLTLLSICLLNERRILSIHVVVLQATPCAERKGPVTYAATVELSPRQKLDVTNQIYGLCRSLPSS